MFRRYCDSFGCKAHKLHKLVKSKHSLLLPDLMWCFFFRIPTLFSSQFRFNKRKTRSICHFHALLPLLWPLRGRLHHLPKLNMARRNLWYRGRCVHLILGVLAASKSPAENAIAKDSRSGNGHEVRCSACQEKKRKLCVAAAASGVNQISLSLPQF